MANGNYEQPTSKAYEDFKNMTPDQKEYAQFAKIHEIYLKVNASDEKYAKKWVETFAKAIITIILIAFFGALVSVVIPVNAM